MAKSLYNEYEQLLSSGSWKYYPLEETLGMKMFSDRDSIISFFKHYIGKGEKANMPIVDFIDNLSMDRLQHTLSCFLLGILLYERSSSITCGICRSLRKKPINNPETMDERFKYLWLLISIFHDFGYAIENKDVELSIKEFDEMITKLHSRQTIVPSIYSKILLRNYAKYRVCRFGVYDHGICGGLKLYAELCQLRENKASSSDQKHYWGEDLIPHFALAAWTVACHNIWLIKDCEKNANAIRCYKCFNLDKLIYHGTSRIIKESPFLFLLCLVDSIEPIKIFDNFDKLKQVKFVFPSDNIIEIDINGLCLKDHDTYIKKIVDINDWLCDTIDTVIKL